MMNQIFTMKKMVGAPNITPVVRVRVQAPGDDPVATFLSPTGMSMVLSKWITIPIPVEPHEAVAEVSRIGNV